MNEDQILDYNFNSENDDRQEVKLLSKNYFIVLYLLTFGLYGIWWQYKMWIFFKQRQNLDIMPVPRAIFSIFFIYSLFEKILAFGKYHEVNKNYSSGGLFALYVVLTFVVDRLPDPLFLLSFFAVFAFLPPLNVFNLSMQNSDEFNAYYANGFSQRQLIIIGCGVIFWLLVLIGTFAE